MSNEKENQGMSSLRKQFEAWWNTERLATAFDSFKSVAEEAFKAGHAASGRDELLEALEQIEEVFHDSPSIGKLSCEMVAIASEAIDKARGEA